MKRYEQPDFQQAMRIRLDVNHMMQECVGEKGLCKADLQAPCYQKAAERAHAKRAQWAFCHLPEDAVLTQIETMAAQIRRQCEAFVVFGIGGSALGPMAVHQALQHLHYNELPAEKRGGPRFYVEDNVDPERMAALLDVIDPGKTCFNVITKSGSTSETMAQMMILTRLLKDRGLDVAEHVIATTDAEKGNLIQSAKRLGLRTLYVPSDLGGRFSELSPVGLLSAAVCGIDIREMVAGAAFMDTRLQSQDVWENMAYLEGAMQMECMRCGRNIAVMMPYADSLKLMADWYAQLWAESLGKRYNWQGDVVAVGQTPVKALGVTDQHSQVQLYVEGPDDKVVTFIGVDAYRAQVPIPLEYEQIPDVAFLGGHSLNELIAAELFATGYALAKAGKPNKTIFLPEVNAFTIGQLLYFFEMATAYAGEVLDINAFDQPGVEGGKQATYALLGKPGFEVKKQEMDAAPKGKDAYRLA